MKPPKYALAAALLLLACWQVGAQSHELRIMALGDSTLSGLGSIQNDGFRRYLRDKLIHDGFEVDMVGRWQQGSMTDNDHETREGDTIDAVRDRLHDAFDEKPNIVLLHAGVVDANRSIEVDTAGDRMENILNDIWEAPDMNSSCVFLSTLLPTIVQPLSDNRVSINDQYRELVEKRAARGDCIYLAEMSDEHFDVSSDFCSMYILCDDVHPNDMGQEKVATVFRQAISAAIKDGKLKEPANLGDAPTFCDKVDGTDYSVGHYPTQRGPAVNNDGFSHDSELVSSSFRRLEHASYPRVFARLFSKEYDDLVLFVSFPYWASASILPNSADGRAVFPKDDLTLRLPGCYQSDVRFADMNGDGLDDYVCIGGDGALFIAINNGDGDKRSNKPPTLGNVVKVYPAGVGRRSDKVMVGDVDGDGRTDYGISHGDGRLEFWRNVDEDNTFTQWEVFAVSSPIPADLQHDDYGYRLRDVNGDGRDDLVIPDAMGDVIIFFNTQSCEKASDGRLNIIWRPGKYSVLEGRHGATWGHKDLIERVHFARLTNEPGRPALMDFVYLEKEGSANRMRVWRNKKYHGVDVPPAEGNMYCNMLGHKNGAVDRVWADEDGNMQLWANRGEAGPDVDEMNKGVMWSYRGDMWKPPRRTHRYNLQLADWDGDGLCDIIHVHPLTGEVEVLRNDGGSEMPSFSSLGNPAPNAKCEHRIRAGLGYIDRPVRIADLTGNGRADYLCIAKDASTNVFFQDDEGNFEDGGPITMPDVKAGREDYRWADVNGDGRVDMILVDKLTGDSQVWYNDKPRKSMQPASMLEFREHWPFGRAFAGQAAGACQDFFDIDGNGLADLHAVLDPLANKAISQLAPSCDAVLDEEPLPDSKSLVPFNGTEYCVRGTAAGKLQPLCAFACRFNFCPEPLCTCLEFGESVLGPEDLAEPGTALEGLDDELVGPLCAFACSKLFCPPTLCNRAESEIDPCDETVADVNQLSSWARSGAERMAASFIIRFGKDNWLNNMDEIFRGGQSALQCDAVFAGACPVPEACPEWHSATFYHVRLMASRVNSHFASMGNALQDNGTTTLARVDSMVVDFRYKADKYDTSAILTFVGVILASISTFIAIGGEMAAGGLTAGFFSAYFGSIASPFFLLGNMIKSQPDLPAELHLAAQQLLAMAYEQAADGLKNVLAAIFGADGSDPEALRSSGSPPFEADNPEQTIVNLLHREEMYSTLRQSSFSAIVANFTSAFEMATLGGVLGQSKFLVIGVRRMTEAHCAKSYAARWARAPTPWDPEAMACLFLVTRQKRSFNDPKTESIPREMADRLENKYDISLKGLVESVALCHSENMNSGGYAIRGQHELRYEQGMYPTCSFGLPFVDAGCHLLYPFACGEVDAMFQPEYPFYVTDDRNRDEWNEPKDIVCKTDRHEHIECRVAHE